MAEAGITPKNQPAASAVPQHASSSSDQAPQPSVSTGPPLKIVILTAGGAGMFCGSCMHDNTWARALLAQGHDVTLLPLYTPIRVDEDNVSEQRVLLGGVNVYLNFKSRFWRSLPAWLKRWADAPGFLNWATRRGVSNDARELGELTIATLAGANGPLSQQIVEIADFVGGQLRPDVVVFTNSLLSGIVPSLKKRTNAQLLCTLQGDDIFLDQLVEPYRQQVLDLVQHGARGFDGFLCHSDYYAGQMSELLQLPRERIHRLPLSIDCSLQTGRPLADTETARSRPPTIGYFARIDPAKGLHNLIAAFLLLATRHPTVRLRIGGYQLPHFAGYFAEQMSRVAELADRVDYVGSPATQAEKVAFLESVDVLSVPTDYREPKGLFVLEALANRVPVVLPAHGAFPELIASTAGGRLVPPGDPAALAETLEELLADHSLRQNLAEAGYTAVRARHDLPAMAQATEELFRRLLAAAR